MVARDQATSAGPASGRAVAQSSSRLVCAVRPSADRPDTSHAQAPDSTGAVVVASVAGAPSSGSWRSSAVSPLPAGASSRMTWTLVPLPPNAETPARRTRSPTGHGTDSVSSFTWPTDQST
ncbi:hypothetical protein Ahu01nite_092440 [Winogradskya humida]|uniref:Uncharacterized protein n=1 Tax=Winogradskya humida TaxID=113566 RepID=A0ABQ4A5L5_9ACTN|nr:hypothetical protein Ahu01nite_092440 [Actinoplanes humidus]